MIYLHDYIEFLNACFSTSKLVCNEKISYIALHMYGLFHSIGRHSFLENALNYMYATSVQEMSTYLHFVQAVE